MGKEKGSLLKLQREVHEATDRADTAAQQLHKVKHDLQAVSAPAGGQAGRGREHALSKGRRH